MYMFDNNGYASFLKLIESNLNGCNNMLNINIFIKINIQIRYFYV